jgi:predicted Zn-ribbon and HTH transcriptional regulator
MQGDYISLSDEECRQYIKQFTPLEVYIWNHWRMHNMTKFLKRIFICKNKGHKILVHNHTCMRCGYKTQNYKKIKKAI